MNVGDPQECCPPFNPEPWDEQRFCWEQKLFIKDRVKSFFHIPLNMGSVIRRNLLQIDDADAVPEQVVILSDEASPWGANLFFEVTKEVPGTDMTAFSGTFLSKVFEGPYREIKSWIKQMKQFVEQKGDSIKELYFYYTTCPKCARKYGKNYVVLLAQIK